jgi:glycosyltransferase involved in cell wall biosynthesis
MVRSFSDVIDVCKRYKPDLLHFHDPEILLSLPFVRKHCGRIVYDSHEHVSEQTYHKEYIPTVARAPLARTIFHAESALVRFTDAVVAPTDHIVQRFSALGKRTILVANFPEINQLGPTTDKAIRLDQVCYTGALSKARSVTEMIEAARIGQFRLVIAGPASVEVRAMLSSENLPPNVTYLGVLPRAEALALQRQSKVGYSLLKPTPQYSKAIPTKGFEYLATDVVPVIDNMPFMTELFARFKTIRHCNPFDPSSISQATLEAIADYEELSQYLRDDQVLVQSEYSWESQGEKLVELYDHLLGVE